MKVTLRFSKRQVVVAAIALALVAGGAWWWVKHRETADVQGSVVVDSPAAGSTITDGQTFSGSSTTTGVVYVWVKGVNFAVATTPTGEDGETWSYAYAGGLEGPTTLGFSVTRDGSWSEPTYIEFVFGTGATQPLATSDWPAPFRTIFQPIEKAGRAVVAFVTSSSRSGAGDLDGNGVSDRWQGSPVSPASGAWARIPYANLLVTLFLVAAVVAVVWAWKGKAIGEFLLARRRLKLEEAKVRGQVDVARAKELGSIQRRRISAMERLALKQKREERGPSHADSFVSRVFRRKESNGR